MLSFGIMVDANYVFSNGSLVSIEHISLIVRIQVSEGAKVRTTGDWNIQFFVGTGSKFHEQLAFMYLAVAGHTLWKERNNRIHNLGQKKVITADNNLFSKVNYEREGLPGTSKLFQKQAARDINIVLFLSE